MLTHADPENPPALEDFLGDAPTDPEPEKEPQDPRSNALAWIVTLDVMNKQKPS